MAVRGDFEGPTQGVTWGSSRSEPERCRNQSRVAPRIREVVEGTTEDPVYPGIFTSRAETP